MKQHRCAPPTFTCQQCGLIFENAASRRRQKFCSYACHKASLRVDPELIRERHREYTRVHHALYRQSYGHHLVAWRKELRRRSAEVARAARAAAVEQQKIETVARFAASADRRRELQRAWRLAHPGRMRELKKAWQKANPDKVRAERRRYRKANPEKERARRRAQKKRNPKPRPHRNSKSNARRRVWLMTVQKGKCAICREKLGAKTEIDHVIPRALGGPDRRSNLQLTCIPCNQAKSAHHPVDFMRSRGLLL